MTENYYRHHVFFCTRQRVEGEPSCQNHNAKSMHKYLRERIKELEIFGQGAVRTNSTGCLGRCEQGPVIVVYPEGVWYNYKEKADIDEIISEHLQNGRVVERLKI